ncbi:uncharacterized protein LOC125475416 isoform X2 [Pyrus x bretschneideri]|nr:uncharacterized protein LOC125475416 isoform X2 [Pyrus x bretschneideri]
MHAGLPSKRRGDSAGSKSADCSVLGGNKIIDDGDQAKESDRLMDDDQISAGKLEADMKTGIDSATAGEHKVIEREDDKAKENDGLKDNGQISVGELEADMNAGIDSATEGEHKVIDESVGDQAKENDELKDNGQISAGELAAQLTPVTMTLSKGESPKVDIEPSGRECFKELMELGKGAENARSLNVS